MKSGFWMLPLFHWDVCSLNKATMSCRRIDWFNWNTSLRVYTESGSSSFGKPCPRSSTRRCACKTATVLSALSPRKNLQTAIGEKVCYHLAKPLGPRTTLCPLPPFPISFGGLVRLKISSPGKPLILFIFPLANGFLGYPNLKQSFQN